MKMRLDKLSEKLCIPSFYGTDLLMERSGYQHSKSSIHRASVTDTWKWNWKSIWALLQTWRVRHQQRQELLELSDHLLRDIGINRTEAEHEANKWFWQV